MRRWCCALAMVAGLALAGGRARLGGTLEAAAVVKTNHAEALLADTPLEAALSVLTRSPPCRLADLSRPTPRTVRLSLRAAVRAADVAQALQKVKTSGGPYRALLAPLKATSIVNTSTLDLELDSAAPDFEVVLCHPVLAVGPSHFAAAGDRLIANADPGLARPWVDSITVRATDARTAERLIAQRKAQVLLGAGGTEGELLYATYLVAHRRLGAAFAQALESSVDRPGLTRFFVPPPARPMSTLIPPGALPSRRAALVEVTFTTPQKPAPLSPPLELTLVFDETLDEHRAVAERLQVKLGPLGYRLKIEALSRRALRERLAAAPDLALVGLLLPPAPLAASALALSLVDAPRLDLDGLQEPARVDAVFERASRATANLFPLFVQGLGVTTTRDVQHLTRDGYGLPRLDDVFLAAE